MATLLSDEALLLASRDGDLSAWDSLLERHGERLFRFLRRMSGPGTAEGLFSETWVEFFHLRVGWTPGTKVATALFALAVRLAEGRPADPAALAEAAARVPDRASLASRGARFDAAVAALPLKERACLLLCYVDALSFREAGLALSMNEAAVKQHCAAAYLAVSRALGADFLERGLL